MTGIAGMCGVDALLKHRSFFTERTPALMHPLEACIYQIWVPSKAGTGYLNRPTITFTITITVLQVLLTV